MSLQASSILNSEISRDILRTVEELRLGSGFGSVEIVLHDGRVTQIEKREKLRFAQNKVTNSPTAPAAVK